MAKKYSFEQISELSDELTELKKSKTPKTKETSKRTKELQKIVKDWVTDNKDAFKMIFTQSQTIYNKDSKLISVLKKKGEVALAEKVQKVLR